MKAFIAIIAITLLWGAVSQSARAGDFSVGLMAGQANFDGVSGICSELRQQTPVLIRVGCTDAEETDSSMGINVAYHFNDTWAIEGGYVDLGEYVTTLRFSGTRTDITLTAEALYLAAVGTVPLSTRFSLSGRAGVYEPRGEVGTGALDAIDMVGDTEFYAGASLDFRATDKIVLQARYDSFDEINTIAAGIQFRF